MNKETTIHYHQAVNLDQFAVRAEEEKYEERLFDIMRWFGKNTIAQLGYFEHFQRAMELGEAFQNKDYSKFLFDEADKLFEIMKGVETEVEAARPTFQRAAQLVSSQLNKP